MSMEQAYAALSSVTRELIHIYNGWHKEEAFMEPGRQANN